MRRKATSLGFTVITMLIILSATIPLALTEQSDPQITVDKSVSLTEIYLKGDGGSPDTATVVLTIEGAGKPIQGEKIYPPTDVVFVIDDTGSMNDDIARVKEDIIDITDTLTAEITDIRFGLVTYKDEAERDLDLTFDVLELKSKIDSLTASGGGDTQEAVKPALELAYASNWRSGDVTKVVILIGDAPPHDEMGAKEIAAEAYADESGIYTSTISCVNAYCPGDISVENPFINIASAGKGKHTGKTNPEDLTAAIIDSILKVVPLIDIAGENVSITGVLPDYIEASAFRPAPTLNLGNSYRWDFGRIKIGETRSITFDIKCTEAEDRKAVYLSPDTTLTYDAWDGTAFKMPKTVPFPEAYIDCKVSNQPPVAEAGPDMVLEQYGQEGANVTLNGSGSSDDDRLQPLTYTWTWENGIAEGMCPEITLPVGLTTINLEVFDGELSDSDTVDITVLDKTPQAVKGCVFGVVWKDDDKDGIQEKNERGIPGVQVELWDEEDNKPVDTTSTFGIGQYYFCGLSFDTSKNYYVRFINPYPKNHKFSPKAQEIKAKDKVIPSDITADRADSDVNYYGITDSFAISPNIGTEAPCPCKKFDAGVCKGKANEPDCGCKGRVTWLKLKYTGNEDANVEILKKNGESPLYSGKVPHDGVFEFGYRDAQDKEDTLGTEIVIYKDGIEHASIHTSCSRPIGINMIFGDFVIVGGASLEGGVLLEVPAETTQEK